MLDALSELSAESASVTTWFLHLSVLYVQPVPRAPMHGRCHDLELKNFRPWDSSYIGSQNEIISRHRLFLASDSLHTFC
jgi:hypothetical protein